MNMIEPNDARRAELEEELRWMQSPNDARREAIEKELRWLQSLNDVSYTVIRPDGSQTTMTETELRAMAKAGFTMSMIQRAIVWVGPTPL